MDRFSEQDDGYIHSWRVFDCMLVLRDKVNSLVTNLRGKIFNDMGDVLR